VKIAVTSTGPSLDDQVEPRFGRCTYFLVVDTDTMEFEAIQNPNIAAGGGAGVQSAQLMADKEVSTVLTGNCGPNAFHVFGAAGIQVIVGVTGTVRDAVEQYKQGGLSSASQPNVESHFGMGGAAGPGGGMGGGMGRGRGIGGGMGRGQGMGRGMGMAPGPAPAQGLTPGAGANDVDALRAQAKALEEQLKGMNDQIAELEGQGGASPLVAVLDADKCTACGVCVETCPVGAIGLNDKAVVDRATCTGCGRCVAECPQDALSLQARS